MRNVEDAGAQTYGHSQTVLMLRSRPPAGVSKHALGFRLPSIDSTYDVR